MVKEEAADGVEGGLGEVAVVGVVLLHAPDQHQVRLLPQLVEPCQGLGQSSSIYTLVSIFNLLECEGNI